MSDPKNPNNTPMNPSPDNEDGGNSPVEVPDNSPRRESREESGQI